MSALIIIGSTYYAYDKFKDELIAIATDEAEEALDKGEAILVNSLSDLKNFIEEFDYEALGVAIGAGVSAALNAGGGILGGIGKEVVPNLIEGVEIGYDKIREKLSGNEPNIIAAFTVGFLTIFSMLYLFYEIRRGK
jgi:hypothetical protein